MKGMPEVFSVLEYGFQHAGTQLTLWNTALEKVTIRLSRN
jgi:hypothetical protein